jgi:hypothetical protein
VILQKNFFLAWKEATTKEKSNGLLATAQNTKIRAVRVECSQLTLDNLLSKITERGAGT